MKKKLYNFLFALVFLSCKNSRSQKPFLTVHYSYSEKSKDSHSITEDMIFTGTSVVYSVIYTGRRGPDQKDETKECTLTSEQLSAIRKAIKDKRLDVTDSLVDNSVPAESYLVTTSTSITFTNGNKTSKTKVIGKPSALGDKPLYKNSLSLLNLIRGMLNNCHQ